MNLLIGQQDQYGGIFGPITRRPQLEFDPTGEIRMEAEAGHDLKASQISRTLTGRALARIVSEPGPMVRHYLRKTYRFWSGYELPQIVSWNFWRHRFAPLRWLVLPFLVLSVGGLLGLWRLPPPARRALVAIVLGYFVSMLPFFPTTRYRLPIVPLLALATAAFVFAVGRDLRTGRRRAAAGWLTAAAALAVVLWPSWSAFSRQQEWWHSELNLASRASEMGDRGTVLAACATAESLRPGLAETPYRQAGYLERLGDLAGALASFDEAVRREADDPFIQYRRARCLASLHRYAEAEAGFLRAAALDTAWAAPYHGLALMLRDEGEFAQAAATMTEAIAREPGRARYRGNLASLYAESGHLVEAAAVLAQLTRDFPGYVPGWYNLAMVRWRQGDAAAARQALARARALRTTADERRQIRELARLLGAAPDSAH